MARGWINLKTFRLASLAINLEEDGQEEFFDIPLLDGLIINKEDGETHWMIEAFVEKKYHELFQERQAKNEELHLQVKISKKTNDPAFILAHVVLINILDDHMSVLIEGVLIRSKFHFAEVILTQLVEAGLQGDELIKEFSLQLSEKRVKKSRPLLR